MKSFKKNPIIPGIVYVNGIAFDDTTVVSGDEYEPFADPNTFPGWTPVLVESTYERFLIRIGDINDASDFPDPDLVSDGWMYRLTADVKDNDPTKTNTGQEFFDEDEIAWNAALSQWILIGARRNVATIISASSPYNVADEDELLIANTSGGVVQFNLQTAVGKKGKRLEIKRLGASVASIVPSGAQKIDGTGGYSIGVDKGYVVIESDGANWFVMTPQADIDVIAAGNPITKVLYVDGSRSDSYTPNGSITKPFKVLADAITAAASGTLIVLMPGTYAGPITMKDGVSLVGTERDRVLITSAVDTISIPNNVYCVIKDMLVSSSGSGKAAIKRITAGAGWVKLQNVFASSAADGYPIYAKDAINVWGRDVDTEGGQVYFDTCSGINIDGLQFCGKDPITALYVKDCPASNAVILRNGAILGVNVGGGGNKAAVIENSNVTFFANRIQSAIDDALTIADGAGASVVEASDVDFVINNPAKKAIILEAASSLSLGTHNVDLTKVTFTGTLTYKQCGYVASVGGDWNGAAPITVGEALDRIAAVLKTHLIPA